MKRTTIRFNDLEAIDLERFKTRFHISNDSEAIHLAVKFAADYIDNVTELFFGSNYDVALLSKRKNRKIDRKVY